MKRLKYLFSIVLLLFAISTFSQVEIKKSTEKVRIGNKVYFVHHVKQGETVYSLCRVYNVSQKELEAENPQLKKGLQAGDRLKIPEKAEQKVEQKTEQEQKVEQKIEQKIEQKVEKKTEYNVEQIKIVMPNSAKTDNSKIDEKENAEPSQSAIKHKIKSGDKLESIAKQYNCSIADILRYNTFLDINSKLKKGQYLTIYPNTNSQENIETVAEKTPQNDTDYITQDFDDVVDCNQNTYFAETMNIVLILPINAATIKSNSTKNNRNAYDFLEFYEGFLLAVDSLSQKNISINLTTFDVYDKQTLNEALQSQDFENAQLVMAYTSTKSDLDIVAKAATQYKIPVVAPFYQKIEDITANNKYFIQTTTPQLYQNEKMSSILCNAKENVIILYEKITDTTNYEKFLQNFKDCDKNVKTYQYSYAKTNLTNLLNNKTKNTIFLTSNNQVFVADLLTNLNSITISSKYDITVYGTSTWKSFENQLNFDYIHTLNLSLLQQNYIDYGRNDVKNFIGKYRHYYKGDPSSFSFQGYDLGIYFISKLAKYGENLIHCITNDNAETLLQTRLKFSKISSDGGLVNTESLLLQHTKDFNIVVE